MKSIDSNDREQAPVASSSIEREHHFQDARFTSPGFVVAVDFYRDGTHHFHSEVPLTQKDSLYESLPPVPPEAVRVFLEDSQVFRKPSDLLFHGDYDEDKIDELPPLEGYMRPKEAGQGMARLGGSASHDDGRPLTKSSFAHVKARTFDVFDLDNFWRPQKDRTVVPFHVQWSVPKKDLDGPQYVRKDKVLEAKLGDLFFCDRLYPYWEFISTAESSVDRKGGIQSTLTFPLLPMAASKKHTPFDVEGASAAISVAMVNLLIKLVSPLKIHFVRIISETDSATRISGSSSHLRLQLVTIDFLRAVLECWLIFLVAIQREVLDAVEDQVDITFIMRGVNILDFKELGHRLADLEACVDFAFSSSLLSLAEAEASEARKLKMIEITFRAKLKAAKTKVDVILDTFITQIESKSEYSNRHQERSLKRLTILASVFLPLSLSCSILSMGSRVTDLGLIWYDWAGLCALWIFIVFSIYYTLKFTNAVGQYTKYVLTFFMAMESWFFPAESRRIRLLGVWMGMVYRIWKAVFGGSSSVFLLIFSLSVLVVVSFGIGIFRDLNLGLRILGFGAAAWAFLFLVHMLVETFLVMRKMKKENKTIEQGRYQVFG